MIGLLLLKATLVAQTDLSEYQPWLERKAAQYCEDLTYDDWGRVNSPMKVVHHLDVEHVVNESDEDLIVGLVKPSAVLSVSGVRVPTADMKKVKLLAVNGLLRNRIPDDLPFYAEKVVYEEIEGAFIDDLPNTELIAFSNCTDIELNINDENKLTKGFYYIFTNVKFTGNFNFKADGNIFYIRFKDCVFDVEEFNLDVHSVAQVHFENCDLSNIHNFKNSWSSISPLFFPNFFFWDLKAIDSEAKEFGFDYDDCLSAEANKLIWYEDYSVALHKWQEYFQNNYRYAKGDSVFHTIKELETARFAYESSKLSWWSNFNDKFRAELYYGFNRFMGWYCDYGTNPVKSIYNSFYIILIFGLFFLLFPTPMSEPTPVAENEFVFMGLRIFVGEETELDKLLQQYGAYIKENPKKDIRGFLKSQSKGVLNRYRETLPPPLSFYVEAVMQSGNSVFFRFLSWIYAAPFWFKLNAVVFFEKILRIRVEEIVEKNKKLNLRNFLNWRIALFALLFGILFILWRFPKSMLISINAFSTLGFGQLPLQGLTKYIAIIEGLFGWFTLSLFSITFVNILLR